MTRGLHFALVILCCVSSSTGVFADRSLSAERKTIFEKMNAPEKDGKITEDQYKASRTSWFEEMDTNNAGKLSQEEFMNGEFAKLDAPDPDGMVTTQEYVIFFVGEDYAEQYKKAKTMDTKSRTEFGQRGMDTNKDGVVVAEEFIILHKGLFEEMDANADGKVSRDEFDVFRGTRFHYMDADGDGLLTIDEFMGN